MAKKRIYLTFKFLYIIILAFLISLGSIQAIYSYQTEDMLNYEEDEGINIFILLDYANQMDSNLFLHRIQVIDDEETRGGEICDPSDEECGCIFPFIPEEYRILVITLMLIAAILSFVCYDILMIRKRNNS